MADLIVAIPAKGALVRTPSGQVIPRQGLVVDRSIDPIYWARKERTGDLSFAPVPPEVEVPDPVVGFGEIPPATVEE